MGSVVGACHTHLVIGQCIPFSSSPLTAYFMGLSMRNQPAFHLLMGLYVSHQTPNSPCKDRGVFSADCVC